MSKDTFIAIVGMAGRFPGAKNIQEYWTNLQSGVESILRLSDEQLLAAGVSRSDLSDPSYVKVCPVLEDIDKFDAAFFGMSPREASVMDPAHRLFLQCVWEAVEHSGNACLQKDGKVAVFAGSGAPLYWASNLKTNPELMRAMGDFLVRHTGNDMNFLATRASYEFDFRGPSINVQTACSSGLVATHLAKESLLKGECDIAIAGAATVLVPMAQGYHYKEGEILSPDGHCRPFDRDSAGTVFGSGVGCVVLKRLDDALDDGDTIHTVIRGSAINNDGSAKVGYLAPGVDGQSDVIRAALLDAETEPGQVSYVETHGTGTLVGDPIELTALQHAFDGSDAGSGSCAIGSVKSNIGHLGEAAAMASLIKAVLALKHRQIPATLGYRNPNPEFDFKSSSFFVNDHLRDWKSPEPLRCGVTALGAGGTNCHLVLEEAPPVLEGEGGRDEQLLMLSAKSVTSLKAARTRLADHLELHPSADLADVAYTLAVGRREFTHRHVVIAKTSAGACAGLRETVPFRGVGSVADKSHSPVVFSFPGGGAQYAQMGRGLYDNEPVYRDVIDECFEICSSELGLNLRSILFAGDEAAADPARSLARPSLGLPALLATEIASARLYESWGVIPEALLGHSMGECAAACFAGVMSLEDALRLVVLRGRLFEQVAEGRMVGVCLPEDDLRSLMPAGLDIAAANAPDLCVGSGPVDLIEQLSERLTSLDHEWTPIHINVAAHSSMLEPILDEFRAMLETLRLSAPSIPIVSNLTGTWLTDEQAMDPDYWTQHLRNTIRFSDCVQTLLGERDYAFLELGPGRALTSLVKAQTDYQPRAVNSMRSFKEDCGDLQYSLLALGQLWTVGAELERDALYAEELRCKVPLPSYSFDEQSYWVEPGKPSDHASIRDGELHRIEDLDQWFSTPVWTPAPLVSANETSTKTWLLFTQQREFVDAMCCAGAGQQVITVSPGVRLEQLSSTSWTLDPGETSQYVELLERLEESGVVPQHIVYMWSLNPDDGVVASTRETNGVDQDTWFAQFLSCFSAAVSVSHAVLSCLEQVQLSFVSEGAFLVNGESPQPMQSLLLGPALVTPREMPTVTCRLIDLSTTDNRGPSSVSPWEQLVRELMAETGDRIVALRRHSRFVRRLSKMVMPKASDGSVWAGTRGAVLITGGLGGLGLEVARHLAQNGTGKLALMSRTGLDDREQWAAILEGRVAGNETTRDQIRKVSEIQALGAQVLVVRADLSSRESLSAGLGEIEAELGPVTGVVHAAGVLDDGPILSKTPKIMQRVLAPKVQGALLLDELLGDTLDFFVAFSSVSSFLGLPGQVDYTSANAFLDAFIEDRRLRCRGRNVVVNWNAWRDVGMVARALSPAVALPEPGHGCSHPVLDGYTVDGAGQPCFVTRFSTDRHWMLAEHQIAGASAVLPGTGFLELARAVHAESQGPGPIEISHVTFSSPFQVVSQQVRPLEIRLRTAGGATSVEMSSVM